MGIEARREINEIKVKKTDDNGQYIIDKDGNPILEEIYSVKTGTVLTINTETKKLYDEKEEIELTDISASFTFPSSINR